MKWAVENGVAKVYVDNPEGVQRKKRRKIVSQKLSRWNFGKHLEYLTYKLAAVGIELAAVAEQTETESSATRLLIYDFGGGTFDVSLIQKDNGIFKQIKTDGDPKCGGNLLTNILAKNLLTWANEEYGTDFPWEFEDFDEDFHGISELQYRENISSIIKEANEVKISLSDVAEGDEVTVTFPFWISSSESENYVVDVSRADFEDMISDEINHTVEITRRVVDSTEAKALGGIDKIIIAGGSGQIPMIREVLRGYFGKEY